MLVPDHTQQVAQAAGAVPPIPTQVLKQLRVQLPGPAGARLKGPSGTERGRSACLKGLGKALVLLPVLILGAVADLRALVFDSSGV